MDKVKLPRKMLRDIKIVTTKGYYEGPNWVDGVPVESTIKAIKFTLNRKNIKLFPEGMTKFDDKVLYSHDFIEIGSSVATVDNLEYDVVAVGDYSDLADLKVYLISRRGNE